MPEGMPDDILSWAVQKMAEEIDISFGFYDTYINPRFLFHAKRGHMSPIAISPYASYYCDVILIVTSFATDLATPTVTDVRTRTLPHLIYKEDYFDRLLLFDVKRLWLQ